jgi:hypothetical protein
LGFAFVQAEELIKSINIPSSQSVFDSRSVLLMFCLQARKFLPQLCQLVRHQSLRE